MAVDDTIQQAIRAAVFQNRQGKAVADKLIKWFDEIQSGNERIDDRDAVYRRLDTLCAAVAVELAEDSE